MIMDVDLWGSSTATQQHIIGEGFDDVLLHIEYVLVR